VARQQRMRDAQAGETVPFVATIRIALVAS
jgi:hypothetical protein